MPMPRMSRDDFEACIRRTRVTLTEAQMATIYEGWGMVEPMLDRIRTHGRGRAAEPAHVFRPEIAVEEAK